MIKNTCNFTRVHTAGQKFEEASKYATLVISCLYINEDNYDYISHVSVGHHFILLQYNNIFLEEDQ